MLAAGPRTRMELNGVKCAAGFILLLGWWRYVIQIIRCGVRLRRKKGLHKV